MSEVKCKHTTHKDKSPPPPPFLWYYFTHILTKRTTRRMYAIDRWWRIQMTNLIGSNNRFFVKLEGLDLLRGTGIAYAKLRGEGGEREKDFVYSWPVQIKYLFCLIILNSCLCRFVVVVNATSSQNKTLKLKSTNVKQD